MKPAFVSQRVETLAGRDERRDSLDQRLLDWLAGNDLLPVPVPNRLSCLKLLWDHICPKVVILSGGNDLIDYGGDAPERDAVERALLERAMAERIPVFALCRGAQLVLDAFGATLELVSGHIGTHHRLVIDGQAFTVNSYHRWGCREIKAPLRILACSADGVIEAFEHESFPIVGVMWHPERERPFTELDSRLLNRLFEGMK